MTPFDRISLSLTVIRRLQRVLASETQALRSMQLAPLADLQPEKAALVDSYAVEVRHLRGSPELFAALDEDVRETFATATRELQSTISTNVRALETARGVMEGVVRILGDSLRTRRTRSWLRRDRRPTPRASQGAPRRLQPRI